VILTRKNWLVEEVFTDPDKMMGAFYAKKLFSHYAPMLDAGTIGLAPWSKIVSEMQIDVDAFGVNVLAAYNLGFDRRVMRQTNKRFGLGPILPAMDMLDIWQFACETKLSQARYKEIARELGWVSAAGNIRTGAEYAYRFCSGDFGFIEDHTALSDAVIETKILADCYACKKSVPYGIVNAQPWRIVNA
jgi:DNA polymerase III epsilon subunit-like protein